MKQRCPVLNVRTCVVVPVGGQGRSQPDTHDVWTAKSRSRAKMSWQQVEEARAACCIDHRISRLTAALSLLCSYVVMAIR
jgi:hypothetical protein